MKWANGKTLGKHPSVTRSQADYFRKFGALGIRQMFPRSAIERLRSYVMNELVPGAGSSRTGLKEVGEKRHIINVPLAGPIHDPAFYANPGILALLKDVLGPYFMIGNIGVVVARPGSPRQHIHRDQYHLFHEAKDTRFLASLPPYCLNFAIPLVDFDSRTGSTRMWPGSHNLPDVDPPKRGPGSVPQLRNMKLPPQLKNRRSEVFYPRQGDCYLFDYRIFHCGTENISRRSRPLLYLVYQRPWFRDRNFTRIPFSSLGTTRELKSVPPEYAYLFASHADRR